MAQQSGLSHETTRQIVNGAAGRPRRDTLLALARALSDDVEGVDMIIAAYDHGQGDPFESAPPEQASADAQLIADTIRAGLADIADAIRDRDLYPE